MTNERNSILITGGAGFIGSCFVERALAKGYFPVVLDKLTYAGSLENLAHLPKGAFHFVHGDIADTALVAALLREFAVRGVVNFAAESHVDNSISGPAAFIETNITGAFHLLEESRRYWLELQGEEKAHFRFVQISTDEVYGSLGPEGKFSEDSPYRPNSPYSASKAATDHLARAWFHTYGMPVIITHCSNNYGPRQHGEKLIPHMIAKALAGETLPVYGDGGNVRDWIYVEDHCNGVMLALERGAPGESYDFGGNAEVDNLSLVKRLCALLDAKRPRANGASYAAQIGFVADRPGHDRRYAIDDAKACAQLGFARRYRFEEGLEKTVEWYLARCGGKQGKAA